MVLGPRRIRRRPPRWPAVLLERVGARGAPLGDGAARGLPGGLILLLLLKLGEDDGHEEVHEQVLACGTHAHTMPRAERGTEERPNAPGLYASRAWRRPLAEQHDEDVEGGDADAEHGRRRVERVDPLAREQDEDGDHRRAAVVEVEVRLLLEGGVGAQAARAQLV